MLPDRSASGRSRSFADTPQLGGDICLRLTSWDPSRYGVWFCAVDREAMPIAASHNYGGPERARMPPEPYPCAEILLSHTTLVPTDLPDVPIIRNPVQPP